MSCLALPDLGAILTINEETVAQVTGKPLLKVRYIIRGWPEYSDANFAISMADIGIDLTLVEEKLDRLFQLASSWEAVLLFDEADILLEARATEDNITRNSIVSSALSQARLL
jgi:hypothetical protein